MISGELIDDCALAELVKRRAGGRIWIGHDRGMHSVREYGGIGGVWTMVARTAFTQLGYSARLLPLIVIGMLLTYVAPCSQQSWASSTWSAQVLPSPRYSRLRGTRFAAADDGQLRPDASLVPCASRRLAAAAPGWSAVHRHDRGFCNPKLARRRCYLEGPVLRLRKAVYEGIVSSRTIITLVFDATRPSRGEVSEFGRRA